MKTMIFIRARGDAGLPAKLLLGQLDHGLALEGVILGQGLVMEGQAGIDGIAHHLSQLADGEFSRVRG